MKKIIITLFSLILLVSSLASCSRSTSLADYIGKNSDISQEFEDLGDSSDFSMDVDENTLICTYDIASLEGMTEEIAMSGSTARTLGKSLGSRSSVYGSICRDLEDETGAEDIVIIIRYTYNDKVLTERSFTSDDAPDYDTSGEQPVISS